MASLLPRDTVRKPVRVTLGEQLSNLLRYMLHRVLLVICLICSSLWSVAQSYHSSNSFFFLPQVHVELFQGQLYRYQVSIRYVPTDTTAHVSLMAMQVGKNDYDFKKKNEATEIVRPHEWHTYSIAGQIVPGTKKLWFYSAVSGNGTFFFDNLTLQVQDGARAWQDVPITYGDFERSPTPLAGYETGRKDLPIGLAVALAPGQGPDQSQALRLTFSGGTLVKTPPAYGRNAAAGAYCQLPGVKLYYEIYGRGEPLLLLHGNGESISSFRQQIEAFAAHFQVIAVDTEIREAKSGPA